MRSAVQKISENCRAKRVVQTEKTHCVLKMLRFCVVNNVILV